MHRRPIETEPFSIKSILLCFVDGEIHEVPLVHIEENLQQQKKNIYIYIYRKLTVFNHVSTNRYVSIGRCPKVIISTPVYLFVTRSSLNP